MQPDPINSLTIIAGYYWIDIEKVAKEFVRKCDKCKRHAPMIHQPGEPLHSVLSPWLFMKWGMDIVGLLPPAPGKVRFLLILTDYFSKWVEAGSYQKIGEREVVYFLWENIICRFGIPREIACDNESQCIGAKIAKFLKDLKIGLYPN